MEQGFNDWHCEALEAVDTSGVPEMALPRDNEDLIDWLLTPHEPAATSNETSSQEESPSTSKAPESNEAGLQGEGPGTFKALQPTQEGKAQSEEEDEMTWLERCLSPWSPSVTDATEGRAASKQCRRNTVTGKLYELYSIGVAYMKINEAVITLEIKRGVIHPDAIKQ